MTYPEKMTTPPPATGESVALRIGGYTLLEQIEKTLEQARVELEQIRGGYPICISGCGRCCHQNVLVTRAEAELAFSRIFSLGGSDLIRDVRALCIGWITSDNARYKIRGTTTVRSFSEDEQQQLLADFEQVQRSTCPFLTADKQCRVHAIRPIACRAYSVTNMPAPECQRPKVAGETDTMRMFIAGQYEDLLRQQVIDFLSWEQTYHQEGLYVGFWPTMLLSVIDPDELRRLSESPDVPTAKVSIFTGKILPWILCRPGVQRIAYMPNVPKVTPEALAKARKAREQKLNPKIQVSVR